MKIFNWLINSKKMLFLRLPIGKLVDRAIECKNGRTIFFNSPEMIKIISLIKEIKRDCVLLLSDLEGYNLYRIVRSVQKINGDIAEVGVFQGGSARLICESKRNKKLYLFDTFKGLPEVSKEDTRFYTNQFNDTTLNDVKDYLKNYTNVYIYQGLFPKTSSPIKDRKFSFVHLDVDLHKSVLDCLEFFYSRMNKGGIIFSHDYVPSQKVFDNFFRDKPEPLIQLSESQCLIVKA